MNRSNVFLLNRKITLLARKKENASKKKKDKSIARKVRSRITNNSFSSMNNNDSIDLDKPRHLTCIFVLIFEYFFPYIYMKRSNSFLFSSTMYVVIYSLPIFKKLSNRITTRPNSSIQTEINYQKRYLFSFHCTDISPN